MGTPLSLRKLGGLAAGAVLLLAACGNDSSDDEDGAGETGTEQTGGDEVAAAGDDGDDGKAGRPSLRREEPMRMIVADAPAVDDGTDAGDNTGDGAAADVPDAVEPPPSSGDDNLDGLAQDCHDGDIEACDQLYMETPIGSELEAYADSCAGRQDLNTGRWCVDVFGDDAEAAADIDALTGDCEGGDMVACDDLYNASLPGSEDQIYGDTCAGRQPVGTGAWCVDSFGEQSDEPADEVSGSAPESTIYGEDFDPDEFDLDLLLEELDIEPFDVDAFLADLDSDLSALGDDLGIDLGVDGVGALPDEPVDVDAADATAAPTSGDENLDGYAQDCENGDMEACDQLYIESEFGSEMQTYADTCAGRQPEYTGRWCVDVFA